jgi:putative flippase GtrA
MRGPKTIDGMGKLKLTVNEEKTRICKAPEGGNRLRLTGLHEPIKFGVVGIVNTGVDITLFLVLLQMGLPPIPANTISFSAGAINSYLANSRFTFRATDGSGWPTRAMVAFFAMTACNVLLSTLLVRFGLMIGLVSVGAKAVSLVGTFLFGFILSKFVIFTEPVRRT